MHRTLVEFGPKSIRKQWKNDPRLMKNHRKSMLGGTIWANFASQAPRGVTLATLGRSLGAPGLPGSEQLQKQWFVPPGPGPDLGVFFR
jgi:hypothetical protein